MSHVHISIYRQRGRVSCSDEIRSSYQPIPAFGQRAAAGAVAAAGAAAVVVVEAAAEKAPDLHHLLLLQQRRGPWTAHPALAAGVPAAPAVACPWLHLQLLLVVAQERWEGEPASRPLQQQHTGDHRNNSQSQQLAAGVPNRTWEPWL
jgi:hypothetical protein